MCCLDPSWNAYMWRTDFSSFFSSFFFCFSFASFLFKMLSDWMIMCQLYLQTTVIGAHHSLHYSKFSSCFLFALYKIQSRSLSHMLAQFFLYTIFCYKVLKKWAFFFFFLTSLFVTVLWQPLVVGLNFFTADLYFPSTVMV